MLQKQRPPRVIIHIGLHQTGTRFLQPMVFGQIDSESFNYNPRRLWRTVRAAFRNPEDSTLAEQAREVVREWRASGDSRHLLLSEPHISGDMYGSHHDFARNLTLLRELFPEATIIFFIRNQADWLQSAYRQQLVKDPGRPIEVFLNWYEGDFRPRVGRWAHGVRNVEALGLRFLEIYRAYAQAYGSENVYLFQQEDLKQRSGAVKQRLAEALAIPTLPEPPRERQQNRSYSALAISLFYPGVHRQYPRPQGSDAGRTDHWSQHLAGRLRKLRRPLIQYGFDRIVYRDWDLLQRHEMRARIDAHYREENAELNRIAGIILEQGPAAVGDTQENSDAGPAPTGGRERARKGVTVGCPAPSASRRTCPPLSIEPC
ncbi:MAG: hypothetical protein ACQETK_06470 [Pseudomonadota bacterium]